MAEDLRAVDSETGEKGLIETSGRIV